MKNWLSITLLLISGQAMSFQHDPATAYLNQVSQFQQLINYAASQADEGEVTIKLRFKKTPAHSASTYLPGYPAHFAPGHFVANPLPLSGPNHQFEQSFSYEANFRTNYHSRGSYYPVSLITQRR